VSPAAAAVLALCAAAVPASDLPDPRVLMEGLAERQQRFEDALDDYTYDLETMSEKLDKSGAVRSRESRQFEVFFVKRKQVRRLVGENGAPLPAERQAKVDAEVQRHVDKVLKGKARPPRTDDLELSQVIARYDFRAAAREEVEGRPAIRLEFVAQPGKRDLKGDFVLRRLAGQIWVDEAERVVVRAEIHTTDTIKVALGLGASIGSAEMRGEFMKVEDGIWLPRRLESRVRGRVLLLKGIHERNVGSFSRYRRFGADSIEVPTLPRP
jgi:hypothetical protein